MELSNSIKKRFVKDYKLPINVVQEPMFSYYIDTLDSYFDTKHKLQLLKDVVNAVGGEAEFFAESNRVKTTIIESIQGKEVYSRLSRNTLEDYNVINDVRQQDIYNMGNVNHTFISIDLKHANFNVFKMFDPALVLYHNTYGDLIGSVTEFDYFKKSKYLRQVIFGNMLPKKQQKLQKWVMNKIISVLHTDVGIKMDDFVSASADEVVFAADPTNIDKFVEMINRKLSENEETKNIITWTKVEAFELKSIGDKKFFVKEYFITHDIEFKSIPSLFFMQVFKKYNSELLEPYDFVFYHEGYLAEFKERIFDE